MIYLLLIIYQVKHFVCDYPLQGKYMLGKFKPFPDCLLPLAAHSSVHGVATLLIASIFKPKIAFWVALLDMVVHGVVDYVKANPNLGGRFKALTKDNYATATDADKKSNVYFWWALGADQMAHHLTHYIIIWSIL
jgi:Protein of unknown function (DUF3307)